MFSWLGTTSEDIIFDSFFYCTRKHNAVKDAKYNFDPHHVSLKLNTARLHNNYVYNYMSQDQTAGHCKLMHLCY